MSYNEINRLLEERIFMIIERLVKQEDFTDVEKSIANYLLQNGYDVKNMSISSLAQVTDRKSVV